ncbi:MAG: 7TM diverse intracellular signaling domain-containing protein [Bacteroidia bacterium]
MRVFVFLIFLSQPVFSTPLFFKNGNEIVEITSAVSYISDTSKTLTRDEIELIPNDLWRPLPNPNPWFGNRANAYWLHFTITNTVSFPLYLNLPYPFNDKVDLYLSTKARQWDLLTSGFLCPSDNKALPIHSYNFLLANPGQTVSAYLRIESNWVVIPIMEVAGAEQFYKKENIINIWQGIYAGIMFALFLYNFNLWLSLRESIYGFYLLYLLSIFLITFHHSGLTCQYLWPCDRWIFFDLIVNVANGIAIILFVQAFLKLRKQAFILSVILWIIASSYILYIPLNYEGMKDLAGQLLQFNNTFAPLLLLAGGLYVYLKKKYNPAVYYLLGWSFFVSSSIILFQIYAGNIKFNYVLFNVVELGSSGEAILFSFALADRVRILRKENRIAEQDKIKKEADMKLQAANNERRLLETEIRVQEFERARIAADLHDELGLSLTMAKMAIQNIKNENIEQQLCLAITNVDQSILSFREIVHNLHPSVIDTFGLSAVIKKVLKNISQKHGIDVQYYIDSKLAFPTLTEIHVYRVFNELINNTLKHSGASKITVELKAISNTFYQLSVSDNGIGIPNAVLLRAISSRLKFLNGKYLISDNEGNGSKIILTFPA